MCMVSLYLLAILCCHTIDWDIFLRYWCLSQIYYYYYYYICKASLLSVHMYIITHSVVYTKQSTLHKYACLLDRLADYKLLSLEMDTSIMCV